MASTGSKSVAQAPAFGKGFAEMQREFSCGGSVVGAGWRSAGENEAVAELHFVPLTEECQEFWQGHVPGRAGEEPDTGPKFARHDVGERPGRDAFRVFGDEFDDFMPVDLFGAHGGRFTARQAVGDRTKMMELCEESFLSRLEWFPLSGIYWLQPMPARKTFHRASEQRQKNISFSIYYIEQYIERSMFFP